jgi:hypothetical protein
MMIAAAQKLSQVSCHLVFKHQTKEKGSRLAPYGLATVVAKQIVVPSQGSYKFI